VIWLNGSSLSVEMSAFPLVESMTFGQDIAIQIKESFQ
jgi:hypothetical protein